VRWDEIAVVAMGGAAGALARWWITEAVPATTSGAWPWATFLTNLTGCLLLGMVLAWINARRDRWPERWSRLARPLVASGILGGYTTFSSYAVEVRGMAAAGQWIGAVTYALASVVIGVGLVVAGSWIAARLLSSPSTRDLTQDEAL
jgi:CrcB protein